MKPAILLLVSLLVASLALNAQDSTRGIGVYPGDPNAYNGALLVPDTQTYRNLALHRPAYHSSSYDYNLTAQLITDGIKETALPRWVSTCFYTQDVELIEGCGHWVPAEAPERVIAALS